MLRMSRIPRQLHRSTATRAIALDQFAIFSTATPTPPGAGPFLSHAGVFTRCFSVDTDFYQRQVEVGGRSLSGASSGPKRRLEYKQRSLRSADGHDVGGDRSRKLRPFTKPLRARSKKDTFSRFDSQKPSKEGRTERSPRLSSPARPAFARRKPASTTGVDSSRPDRRFAGNTDNDRERREEWQRTYSSNDRRTRPISENRPRFRGSDRRIGRSTPPPARIDPFDRPDKRSDSTQRYKREDPSSSRVSGGQSSHGKKSRVESKIPHVPPDQLKRMQRHRIRFFPPNKLDAFVVCHPGLEPFLSQELTALGLKHTVAIGGAQLIAPTVDDLLDCHLHLGTATQVLLRCGERFTARGLSELKRKVQKLPWNEILRDDVQLKVRVSSSKSLLMHSTAIRDRVVQGIYDVLGRDMTKVDIDATAETGETVVPLTVRVSRDQVQISVDSYTTPLHQRGYRLQTGKAPLREDLAHAFLLSAGWKPPQSRGRRQGTPADALYKAFLDPFCGSGTIAIEAACMVSGLPPGRLLSAPFSGTVLHNPSSWENRVMKSLQQSAKVDTSDFQIAASDRDKGALEIAKSNAQRAGVLSMIDVRHCAFSGHSWLEDPDNAPDRLLLAANLPFGRRVSPLGSKSRDKQFLPLHQTLATRLMNLNEAGRQFSAILLTDDPALVRRGGYKSDMFIKLRTNHGGINVSAMLTTNGAGAAEGPGAAENVDHIV